ncbi:heme biosynthesis HemY N-terminal domain-containing protein [Shewanella surugensis]|uniref:Heme biosynthesis protein HemY n=1 Tax=Shewanella surugensis TaxID=212020 RepID=A0ABT0LG60_9GAMM|nr:heme biosynthesis HemY N-terminal domain-containing protein [Shewanella surugensis]MCL1126668.1 heme biosynthesis protein HemY [Shewanella surugensis]
MIRALIYLAIILIGFCISPFLVGNKGYLYIAIADYQIETSLVFAVIAIIVFYSLLQFFEFLLIFFLNLIINSRYLPERWRKNTARKHTLSGALSLAEEDWESAEKFMLKGAAKGEIPTLNFLAAARAAQRQLHTKQRDIYLEKAEKDPAARQAVTTTRTRYLLQQGDLTQARIELDKLAPTSKSKTAILKLAVELYQAQHDWQALKLILPIIKKKQLLTEFEFNQLALKTNTQLLTAAAKVSLQELEKCWHWLSRHERKQPEYIALYALGLAKHQQNALALLLKPIKTQASTPIFDALSQIITKTDIEAHKQLMALESKYADVLSYQCCIATLYQKQDDFNNAKIWWQKVCHQQETKTFLAALAFTHTQLGEPSRALQVYQRALEL